MNSYVRDRIDRIINIMLTDGVQPSDLVSNIYDKSYSSMSVRKVAGLILTDISFDEVVNGLNHPNVTLRYTHNEQKQLLRVEEIRCDHSIVQWDREETINSALAEVIVALENISDKAIANFIESLPPYLADRLSHNMAKAA